MAADLEQGQPLQVVEVSGELQRGKGDVVCGKRDVRGTGGDV